MILIQNIAKISVFVDGKLVSPGECIQRDSIQGIEGRILNGFFKVISEQDTPVREPVVKEQPISKETKPKKLK